MCHRVVRWKLTKVSAERTHPIFRVSKQYANQWIGHVSMVGSYQPLCVTEKKLTEQACIREIDASNPGQSAISPEGISAFDESFQYLGYVTTCSFPIFRNSFFILSFDPM